MHILRRFYKKTARSFAMWYSSLMFPVSLRILSGLFSPWETIENSALFLSQVYTCNSVFIRYDDTPHVSSEANSRSPSQEDPHACHGTWRFITALTAARHMFLLPTTWIQTRLSTLTTHFYMCSQNHGKRLLASSCLSVRPSVRPHGTTRLPLEGFSWSSDIWVIFEILSEKIQV